MKKGLKKILASSLTLNEGRLNSKIFVREQQWATVPKEHQSHEPEAILAQT